MTQFSELHAARGSALLVFDHVPARDALREAAEETGQAGFTLLGDLGSAEWISEAHAGREMRHFHHLLAPPDLPDTWAHAAVGHVPASAGSRCRPPASTGTWTCSCPPLS